MELYPMERIAVMDKAFRQLFHHKSKSQKPKLITRYWKGTFSSAAFTFRLRRTLGFLSICCIVLLKICISLTGNCFHVGGHHCGCFLIIHHAVNKEAPGVPAFLLCASSRIFLSLSQILTELAALTGCSCQTESTKTLPYSVWWEFSTMRLIHA